MELIVQVTEDEMIIFSDKNVVCRAELNKLGKKLLYLHLLLRTQGDSIEIDRDKT